MKKNIKKNMKGNTFTKDELFLCIKKHNDCPVFYSSGYDTLIDLMSKKTNIIPILRFLYDNKEAIDIIYVIFNPKTKLYFIEIMHMKNYISEWVQISNVKENLLDIVRFLNKTEKLEDTNDCQICFDELPHKYSESIFNILTVTCVRCFNTICEKCHITLQCDKYEYTCPFCKMTNKIDKTVKVLSLNEPYRLIDLKVYNKKILEMDAKSKEVGCNDVILNKYLYEWVTENDIRNKPTQNKR